MVLGWIDSVGEVTVWNAMLPANQDVKIMESCITGHM